MDDLKRFRDFRRWESQRAEETYVQSIEEENRQLQRITDTIPVEVEKRFEEMTKYIDNQVNQVRNSFETMINQTVSTQREENIRLLEKITSLEVYVQELNTTTLDVLNKATEEEIQKREAGCEELSKTLSQQIDTMCETMTQSTQEKLEALSKSVEEKIDLRETQTQKSLQKIVLDFRQDVENVEKSEIAKLQDVEDKLEENTRRIKAEAVRLEETTQQVAESLDEFKEKCEADFEKENQETTLAMEALCNKIISESDQRQEDGIRYAMRLEEFTRAIEQKEEVWAQDQRMVQETVHFKLQKFDDDLSEVTDKFQKRFAAQDAKVEGATKVAINKVQEAFDELDPKFTEFDERIDKLTTGHEELEEAFVEQLEKRTAELEEKISEWKKSIEPVEHSLRELDGNFSEMQKKLDTMPSIIEDKVTKVRKEIESLQKKNEGNVSYSWKLTKQDFLKHEVRSPPFSLKEKEDLHLRLHPKGRVTSKPNFSAIALVKKRETTNPFECEDEPLKVTFSNGSLTTKVKELDSWDDELDAAVAENFAPTAELNDIVTVSVVR